MANPQTQKLMIIPLNKVKFTNHNLHEPRVAQLMKLMDNPHCKIDPPLLNKDFALLDGNHRIKAALLKGLKEMLMLVKI